MSSHRSNSFSSPGSSTSTVSTSKHAATNATATIANSNQTRRKRTQYRSCDQCRASKRACDLSATTLSSCSTCITRQIECTTQWLGQKNKKQKQLLPPPDLASVSPSSPSASDSNMLSDALAEHVKGCKLRMYTNLFEFPFSHWLAPGCNPYFPSFDSLDSHTPDAQLDRCVQLTSGVHDQLKGASTNPSKLIQQFSLLDALLLSRQCQQRGIDIDHIAAPRLRGIRERNKVIDEALTWTAVAHAFQYTATADFVASGAQRAEARTRSRTLTTAAWQKARAALFSNVSFHSFRNAFAFLIFGTITPPTTHIAGQASPAEDTAFAVAHGLRLMHTLCQQAKSFLVSTHSTSNASTNVVLHALKATTWFYDIAKAILTPIVKGLIGDDATASLYCDVDPFISSDRATLFHNPAFVRGLIGAEKSPDTLVSHVSSPASLSIDPVASDPWTRVVDQARAGLMSSAIISFKLDAWAAGELIDIHHELNEAAAYKILIWKAVDDLETEPNRSLALDVAIAIASQWHASHAVVVDSALSAYHRLNPESRTMLSFAVQHSSLGLFYLDTLISKLGSADAQRSQEWRAVDPGNLSSARRVAQLCERARQDALAGLTVTADEAENEGTRNLAQTFPMGQWCHPYPVLSIQAQAWAAHHLLRHAEQQHVLSGDWRDWVQLVDHCLFCLDMMQECLAPFPAHALDQMPLEGLLERRAYFLSCPS
ncbi:hypothetical protein EX895_004737 [Sporisorium graminicola]|uniref:Zn(2)-C6 fungal-type domain-containing protein n=1 Tax=Sporisorium graminicola TaxID=280036 RepID=A0A4U7KTI9_9BASI|nr:hypothetical protein EX895_004737 [Sporisorium graminicola]TKY86588.1 hypothetical protein EX895_004737 [Sporisorium graminicola]